MLEQEQDIRTLFPEMAGTSRVWIYQANRFLTEEEKQLIYEKSTAFVNSWESHGSQLKADVQILNDLFLVFSVDENQHEASGCSIDKSVHFVKEIQNLTGINFFDRTIIAYYDSDNVLRLVPLGKISSVIKSGEIKHNTLMFNNLVENLNKMRTEWLVPVSDSWLSRFM
jgi:hypothetical protein